jgi:hypothetical protein
VRNSYDLVAEIVGDRAWLRPGRSLAPQRLKSAALPRSAFVNGLLRRLAGLLRGGSFARRTQNEECHVMLTTILVCFVFLASTAVYAYLEGRSFHHEHSIDVAAPIEWTGRTMAVFWCSCSCPLPAALAASSARSYALTPVDQANKVRWTRSCRFVLNSSNVFHQIFYLCYMPIFRLELMRALRIYQELCKEELESRAGQDRHDFPNGPVTLIAEERSPHP